MIFTIPSPFGHHFSTFETTVFLRITDEGSVPEMRIWSILLIKSDIKWCVHFIRSIFIYLFLQLYKLYIFRQCVKELQFARRIKDMWLQPNSKNCGPPPGNNFDLELGQRSRSWHGVNWQGLTQGTMHAKYQCSIINNSEDISQVKVFVTDRRTDWRTDRGTDEWV